MSIHWDYADSFSGRDAAYLIAGFDPSSNTAEEAYRAQPVIKKLKIAYYSACSALSKSLRADGDIDKAAVWRFLLRYTQEKSELVSVEIENLISDFRNSSYVTCGHLAKLESIDSESWADFPRAAELEVLEGELSDSWKLVDSYFSRERPADYQRFKEIREVRIILEDKYKHYAITSTEYWAQLNPLCDEATSLWGAAEHGYEQICPKWRSNHDSITHGLSSIRAEERDWRDRRSSRRADFVSDATESFLSAMADGEKWIEADSHEFEDQRFTRTELRRWIQENGFPSQYHFPQLNAPRKIDNASPWGDHSTVLLEKLSEAAIKFWGNYDPDDSTTAPTNAQVTAWLVDAGVTSRTAEQMATILRADGLPTGRRG